MNNCVYNAGFYKFGSCATDTEQMLIYCSGFLIESFSTELCQVYEDVRKYFREIICGHELFEPN